MTKRKPFLLVQIKLCFFDLTQLNISCEEKITIKGDANKFQGSPLMLKHLLLNDESMFIMYVRTYMCAKWTQPNRY